LIRFGEVDSIISEVEFEVEVEFEIDVERDCLE
jgi:hypothetical protein